MAGEIKSEQVQSHQTNMEMIQSAPPKVDAGADMDLKVKVSCPFHCNLLGSKVGIVDDEGAIVKETELTAFDGTGNETDEFVVKAPIKPGEHTWTAAFPALQRIEASHAQVGGAQEQESVPHEGSAVPFSFIVKPHATSMAVWDAPSPIVIDAKSKLKVGVSCSANCKLAGQQVTICDHTGVQVGTGKLGDVPWPDTAGLYWTEVEIQAPGTEGFNTWEVKFPTPDMPLAHEGTVSSFSFRTAKPPEHVVTVEVVDQVSRNLLKKALVALHSSGTTYREYTDERGVAKVSVPKGEYELFVAMAEYKEFVMTAKVEGDSQVKAELSFVVGER